MPEFFQTQMGARFFGGTVPALVRALERIADNLEKNVPQTETEITLEEKDFMDWPAEDWKYEVANGDTCLGYKDWVLHNKESDS